MKAPDLSGQALIFFIKIELYKLCFYIIFVKQKQGANYDRKNAEEIS